MKNIEFNNLSFSFNHQPILQNINAEFTTDKVHLLTGISGSGKSTLMKLIAGLLPKYGGKINSGSVHTPTKQIGMLFQDPLMQFALDTPRHELEFTLENCQVPRSEMKGRIDDALEFCQVTSLADRKISTLSGGQQQRIALTTVIAMHPQILLLDEPFANVDEKTRQFILNRLAKLKQTTHVTIIISDHDFRGYQKLSPIVWRLKDHQLTQLPKETSKQLLQQDTHISFNCQTPNGTEQVVIDLNHLTIKQGDTDLLIPTNLKFIQDKVTLLTGPNGIGKSSLLAAIARLIKYQGTINYRQKDIQKISPGKYYKHLALIFQHANDQFLNVTVGEELKLSIKNGTNPYFTSANLQAALKTLGLAGREEQVVYTLSGGQKKKLQILLMLMMGQETLLLDEPFTGLDQQSLADILTLINKSRSVFPQTFIIVSHQLTGLSSFIDYHLVMNNKQLKYSGGTV